MGELEKKLMECSKEQLIDIITGLAYDYIYASDGHCRYMVSDAEIVEEVKSRI